MNKQQHSPRVKISERALIQRVNRRLRQDGEQLRTARSPAVENSVGRYFVVNITRNVITQRDVDLENLARELDAIQAWEELAE